MERTHGSLYIAQRFVVLLLLFSLTGCDRGVVASYGLPLIPIEVSIDTQGNVTVSLNGQVVTPFGTFGIGVYASPSTTLQSKGSLTIRLNGQDTIYPLNEDNFTVNLSPGYYKHASFTRNVPDFLLELDCACNITAERTPSPFYGLNTTVEVTYPAISCRRSPGYIGKGMNDFLPDAMQGEIGVVLAGPEHKDNIYWWKVHFPDGLKSERDCWLGMNRQNGDILLKMIQTNT